MPQISLGPVIGRTMVEEAHCVKVPDIPATSRRRAAPFATLDCVT
jgi:hypothetical protein